jgi:putative endonuclease
MYYIYAIQSELRNYLYVGMTDNVERRVDQHNKGYEKTTRPYLPFRLIHTEKFATRSEARIREKYLKSGIGKEWLRSMMGS